MFRHIRTLRKKLMLTVLLLLFIPMVIVIFIAQTRSQSVIRKQSLTLGTNLVKSGAERLNTSCESLDDIYKSIYLNENFREYLQNINQENDALKNRNDTEELKSIFLSSLSSRSDIFSIIYIDNHDRLIYATRTEAGSYTDYHSCDLPESYHTCILPNDKRREEAILLPTHKHMPLRNTFSSSPPYVYAIARQIVNTEGLFERIGTMFITIDLSDFDRMAELILPDSSSIVFVCDQDGQVIYDSSNTSLMKNIFEDDLLFTDGEAQHEIMYNGTPHVMVSAQSDKTGWYVIMLTPQSAFFANAMSVSSAILTTSILAMVVSVIVTTLASSAISKPVERLADAMDETQLRHLDHRVEVVGQDEIARLGHSFNALLDKLDLAIKNEYETAIQQKNAEIRALQAQMNPHFLYNVLQSISALAILHNTPKIATIATALGSTMRYNISGKEPMVSLRDEILHVENYLTIQKIRLDERFHYEINVPEYVMEYSVPRVSIQPMVENAIIHGFDNLEGTGNISITAWEEGKQLIVEVADDGQGIPDEILKKLQISLTDSNVETNSKSIGISNLNSRIRLMFGEKGCLSIDSEEGTGTVIRITIPIIRR